jgi:hypothetical protein
MLTSEQIDEAETAAAALGVERAALLAVIEVESGGRVFAEVNGRLEPLIRFEGHYFDRLCPPEKRDRARALGLASPRAGAVANPASQAERWALLERAASLDRASAYASTSWGIGQVMGEHWRWLGYESVEALVAEARQDFAGQLALMVRYIEKAGLVPALRARDWEAFARGYNGPAFRRHGYHNRLAEAYRRHGAAVSPLIRRGDRGEKVRALQRLLIRAGFPLAADGIFGANTEAALRRFQTRENLAVDGIAGPETIAALQRYRPNLLPALIGSFLTSLWHLMRRVPIG